MRHLSRRWASTLVVSVCLGATTGLHARQQPSTPTGVIAGRVVDAVTGAPIGGVQVHLGPPPGSTPGAGGATVRGQRVIADDEGRFVFRQLPAGAYSLAATTGGNGFEPSGFLVVGTGHVIAPYLNGGYGQRRPNGPLGIVTLDDNGVQPDVVITLWKPGGIDGTVVDEAGEPLVGVTVAAVRRSSDGALTTGPTTRTDDRGVYHFGSLAPGDYVTLVPQTDVTLPGDVLVQAHRGGPSGTVDAFLTRVLAASGAPTTAQISTGLQASNTLLPTAVNGRPFVYRSTFHPSSATLSEARTVVVKSGETVTGADIVLTPVPAARVTGRLVDGATPVPHFGVRLGPAGADDGTEVLEVAWTATDAEGRFEFSGVPLGQYRLVVQRVSPRPLSVPELANAVTTPQTLADRPGAWASVNVSVGDQPVPELVISLQAPRRITGQVVFTGAAARPTPERLGAFTITAVPHRPARRQGPVNAGSRIGLDNSVVIEGVPPGRYVLAVPEGPPGWSLQSLTLGGRDILDAAFDVGDEDVSDVVVTFTDTPAEIGGIVTGDPAQASVFLFPADRGRWALASRATRTTRSVRVDGTGRFLMPRVPPGDYLAVALPESLADPWPDERWIVRAATVATALRITAGQKVSVALTLKEVR